MLSEDCCCTVRLLWTPRVQQRRRVINIYFNQRQSFSRCSGRGRVPEHEALQPLGCFCGALSGGPRQYAVAYGSFLHV